MVKVYETKYYGIFIHEENGAYWLYEANNGCQQFFGGRKPTEAEIKQFRDDVVKY